VATGRQIGEPLPVSADSEVAVESVAFDPDGRYLADGSVRIRDVSYLTDVCPGSARRPGSDPR
jgi:hypothetical protein